MSTDSPTLTLKCKNFFFLPRHKLWFRPKVDFFVCLFVFFSSDIYFPEKQTWSFTNRHWKTLLMLNLFQRKRKVQSSGVGEEMFFKDTEERSPLTDLGSFHSSQNHNGSSLDCRTRWGSWEEPYSPGGSSACLTVFKYLLQTQKSGWDLVQAAMESQWSSVRRVMGLMVWQVLDHLFRGFTAGSWKLTVPWTKGSVKLRFIPTFVGETVEDLTFRLLFY